jgi:hypothetical protein
MLCELATQKTLQKKKGRRPELLIPPRDYAMQLHRFFSPCRLVDVQLCALIRCDACTFAACSLASYWEIVINKRVYTATAEANTLFIRSFILQLRAHVGGFE